MSDSTIQLPSGISGPLVRASRKVLPSNPVSYSKEGYSVHDYPWTVNNSFWIGHRVFSNGITAFNVIEYGLAWPSVAAAGTALAIKALEVWVGSDGTAIAFPNTLKVGVLSTAALNPTLVAPADILQGRSDKSVTQARKFQNVTIPSSPVIPIWGVTSVIPNPPTVAYQPSKVIDLKWGVRRWQDMILLPPGNALVLYWTTTFGFASPVPNGHQVLGIVCAYDEVTL